MALEVETRSLAEVEELMQLVESGGAPRVTRVMLDNMATASPVSPLGSPLATLLEGACIVILKHTTLQAWTPSCCKLQSSGLVTGLRQRPPAT